MKFLFTLQQIRMQVAKHSELWFLYVNRVQPHVPSLTTPPPPHNCVQNKHVKILHHCRLFVHCSKSTTNSLGLAQTWTRLGRCQHHLTLESGLYRTLLDSVGVYAPLL